LNDIDKPGLFFFWDELSMTAGLASGDLPLFLSWPAVGVDCFADGGATFCNLDGFSSSSDS
jgi:hypothetical protein